jgi:hypothetical protein
MKEGAFGRRESVKIVREFNRLDCSPYSDLEFLLYFVAAISQCLLVFSFIVLSEASVHNVTSGKFVMEFEESILLSFLTERQ